MLKLQNGSDCIILNVDNFYIDELWSGLDELVFEIQILDPAYKFILEEAVVEYEQPYLVKAIDGGTATAKIKCQINVDALKANMLLNYSNGSDTVAGTIEGVLPGGWGYVDHANLTARRTIEMEAGTPLEIIQQCQDIYGVVIRYDVKKRQVHVWDPDSFKPIGAFASRDLNLTEVNYKGKSSDFVTRLYAYGKDDLSIAAINGGKSYVEDYTYSDKIICAYWKDERYTDAENLLADAKRKLKELAVPVVSYSCAVLDLAKTNPELYAHQNFSLMQVIRLVDDIKGLSVNHQVVQYRRYPFYPEHNEITLSTVPPNVQNTVKNLQGQIENPSSSFRQIMQAILEATAASIAGFDGGNLLITQNTEGKPNGILIMDTDSKETARKVLWFNLNGIAYSNNGADGPFSSVWSFAQGGFIADWIVAGTMLADRILGGTLKLGGPSNGNGVCQILDANGKVVGSLSLDGIKATAGDIAGWKINPGEISSESGGNKAVVANGQVGINLVDQSTTTPAITIGNLDGAYMKMGADGFEVNFETSFAKLAYWTDGYNCRISLGQGSEELLRLDSDGMIQTKYPFRGSEEANVYMNGSGVIMKCSSSTRRIKNSESEDLGSLDPKALYKLPVKTYKYNDGYLKQDDSRAGKTFIGFIAEDVAKVYPLAADMDDEGKPVNWNSRILLPAMLKLIQEQNDRIKKLEGWRNEIISSNRD